jgi:predicted N-formylglutamate amidohydrolase
LAVLFRFIAERIPTAFERPKSDSRRLSAGCSGVRKGGDGVQPVRTDVDPWIDHDEPPAFAIVNPEGMGRAVLACDHASSCIPRRLGTLGLEPKDRMRHIAWDIGAAEVARRLSSRLDAPLVLAGYSRLVVDCNRPLGVEDAFAERSEDTEIPGNIGIRAEERAERAETFYWPFHDSLHRLIETRVQGGTVPVLVCVHSFTPVYRGVSRRWHIGVNYRMDARVAALALAGLRREADLTVGENEPYEVSLDGDYTAPVHAERRGRPHVLFEIRQDLIASEAGAQAWADRLAAVLRPALVHGGVNAFIEPAPDVREPRYEQGDRP